MRIIFMGTPDFAVTILDALVDAGHEIVAAYTQPPRPGGRRGKAPTPTPVYARAEALEIPVRHPTTLRTAEAQQEFSALNADVAVVAAYGLILPQAVLDAPRLGCLNVHASLLPRWRGAAPVQRAILAGDAETGVGIMQMEAGLDTGPVRHEVRTAIGNATAGELTQRLAQLGGEAMVEVLGNFGRYSPVPQPEIGVTYAAKLDKAEARLRFDAPAEVVERQVRAFHPASFFELDGERFRVLAAEMVSTAGPAGTVLDAQLTIACGTGAIRPTVVQRAGRGAMATADLLRGSPIPAGTLLS
jgi:methionyl-tRNA formyltransferase